MSRPSAVPSFGSELERIEFEPTACVLETCRALAVDALPRGLSLRAEVAPDVPVVVGDPWRYREVLLMAGARAVSSTESGGVTVRVDANTAASRVRLRTTVSSTGGRMTSELASSFARPIANAVGRSASGFIAWRRLLEAMGGAMSIERATDGGTRLTFEIPFELPSFGRSTSLRPAEPIRVLVAAADLDDGSAARELLLELGIEADVVCVGPDTVDAWLLYPYDLVVISSQAPAAAARSAAHDIREIERTRGGPMTPIVSLVGSPEQTDAARAVEGHVDGVAVAPLTRASLSALVRRNTHPAPWGSASASRAASVPPSVDWERLRELGAGDASFATRILDRFVFEAEQLVALAESAASVRDLNGLLRALDSLKGSGGNVGALELSAVAARAEELALMQGCEAALALLPAVRIALDHLRAAREPRG